jgi:hypothetical protein
MNPLSFISFLAMKPYLTPLLCQFYTNNNNSSMQTGRSSDKPFKIAICQIISI